MEDGRIVSVTSSGDIAPEGDVTLLPGLVDPHLHFALDGTDSAVDNLNAASDPELLDAMRVAARKTLAAGVTTARDLGDRSYLALELRAETAADPAAGPTVLASGPPLTVPDGHCWFMGGTARGAEALRAAVRERFERGADVIKVMATGGGITAGSLPWQLQYDLDELRAIVSEAHAHGLPVTAHAHATAGVALALEAGCDGLEHCTFMTEDGIDVDKDLVRRLADAGTAVSFTLGAVPGAPLTDDQKKRIAGFVAALNVLREGGVNLLCGSDSGIFAFKPHSSLPYAIEAMVTMAGLTPTESLRTATVKAASALGLGDRKGRIAPGYDADLLAVAGNPLSDLTTLHNVRAVYRSGHLVHSS